MALSVADRKHKLPHGAQREIADALADGDKTYVSRAVAGEVHPKTEKAKAKLRSVQEAVAEKLGLPVEDVFGPRELVVLTTVPA